MNDELLDALKDIKDAVNRNYLGSTVEQPGIVEGGIMRLLDKMDEQNDYLNRITTALESIADQK